MVIILKPTYSCNFRCKYCYLSNDTKKHRELFDISFAKKIILQIKDYLETSPRQKVTLIWHGGEPLLWGIENYREIFAFMQKELDGINYHNSIQTNLSLINDGFIDLFLQYKVQPGFSLDGTKEIHDQQRIDANGQPTFDTIMSKLALCREKGLKPGCIVVASRKHIGHIPELYNFMKENKLNFKFNPLFSAGEASNNMDEYGITPEEYARMAIELFDLWFYDNQGKITESNFVEIASNIATGRTSGCMFSRNCQDNFFAVAPTGDVMPCGRFCDDDLLQYSYGNLHNETLSDIIPRIRKSEIYMRPEYIENGSCKNCKWLNICHGGCLHDGFLTKGDFRSKTFLCSAYRKIFAHIEECLTKSNINS